MQLSRLDLTVGVPSGTRRSDAAVLAISLRSRIDADGAGLPQPTAISSRSALARLRIFVLCSLGCLQRGRVHLFYMCNAGSSIAHCLVLYASGLVLIRFTDGTFCLSFVVILSAVLRETSSRITPGRKG